MPVNRVHGPAVSDLENRNDLAFALVRATG